MTGVERKRYITKQLKTTGVVRVNDLARELQVTPVTIRSDLEDLERRGIVVRMHGGAVLPERDELPKHVTQTMQQDGDKKRAIAQSALSLVKPESTVIIDAGSTTAIFAQFLHGRALTVITNSLPVIAELATDKHVTVIASGGAIQKQASAMVGELTRWAYQAIHADVVFLGAAGYSLSNGITTNSLLEADAKRVMIESAETVCLLADSTKLDQVKFAKVCDWERIDFFITDAASDELTAALRTRGVQVLTPGITVHIP